MAIIKYKPYSLFDSAKQEVDRLFDSVYHDFLQDNGDVPCQWCPSVDIKETDSNYVVTADVPGVEPKNIKVSIDNNTLVISGEKKIEDRTNNKGYQKVERYSGSFYRQFLLPVNVDGDKIEAKTRNGVLELTLPKIKSSSAKYIEVKDGN